jgi:hypothetical protein
MQGKRHLIAIEPVDDEYIKVHIECVVTSEHHTVNVKQTDFDEWNDGALAQDVFPYLSPDDRELLITGCGPTGWATIYPKEK